MATDGVKIIDGDIAHDTYWGIMDLYDSNVPIKKIHEEYPFTALNYFDDFENEIYITSCALALWEIGEMNTERLSIVQTTIEKGAGVEEWTECSIKDGKERQKVLEKFWKKINQINEKIRPRKKYRKISKLLFQEDDILICQFEEYYRAIICIEIDQYRGQCSYMMTPTTYKSREKPTVEDIRNSEILGREIITYLDRKIIREKQPEIDRLWNLRGNKRKFCFGLKKVGIDHVDLIHFKDEFEKIGSLKILKGFKATGSYCCDTNFEEFTRVLKEVVDQAEIFPASILCEE